MRRSTFLILMMVLALVVVSCGGAATPTKAPTKAPEPTKTEVAKVKGPIVVSSKNFTEEYLLGWLTILALRDAGFEVESQIDLGGTSANREALEAGEVDVYWEYTGTAWLVHLGHEEAITDPQTAYDKVKAEDVANGLSWLDYAPFNDTYTLMMTTAAGQKFGVQSMSDLKKYLEEHPDAVLCTDQEFAVRPDGMPALQEKYGFTFKDENFIPMEIGVTYKALRDGQCDVAMGFATDGRIAAWGFFNLEDDQQFFPVYNPAPVVRQEVMDEYPEIAGILAPIAAALDTETMTYLNSLVDVGPDQELDTGDEMSPEEVARKFLAGEITVEAAAPPPAGPKGPIVVSSKNFTEEYLLGWLTILALRDAGFEVESQIDLGGTSANREALEAGEVDVYWEYTGTAWLVHLGHEEAITDPQTAYDKVKAEDVANGLSWLDYAPFNDTYTLMMTTAAGQKFGVQSMSDLKKYLEEHPDAVLCTDQEFAVRPDGMPALQEKYGFTFKDENFIPMEIGVTYKALRDGQCDVAMGFATDGRIAAWGFFNLEDDQQFFPVYNPAPVVRQEVMDEYPEIAGILAPIAAALDTETMTYLNSLVDVGPDQELDTGDEMSPEEVARKFLKEQGLIK